MAIILIFSKHICETRHFRPSASIPMMLNPEIMNFITCGGGEGKGGGIKSYTASLVNLPIYFLVRDLSKSTTLATWQLGRIFNSFSDEFYIWDASSFFSAICAFNINGLCLGCRRVTLWLKNHSPVSQESVKRNWLRLIMLVFLWFLNSGPSLNSNLLNACNLGFRLF